jgi:hypothetical protein
MKSSLRFFRSHPPLTQVANAAHNNIPSNHCLPALPRQQKINDFFDKLEQADARRTAPDVSLACYHVINELQKNEKQLRDARRVGDRPLERQLKQKQQLLTEQLSKLIPQGLHGLSNDENDRLWRRRQQWKAAAIEGFHTWSARLCASASGIAGAEVDGAGKKAAVHQSLGYLPQAILSSLLRIVTETLQVRANKAGRPKMAPNLAIDSGFKTNNKQLREARKRLLVAADALAESMRNIVDEGSASDELRQALAGEIEAMQQAIASGKPYARMDENLRIRLKQDFKSKELSAIVSVVSGLASFAALGVEQSGAGTIAAHKLLCLLGTLLQMPASFFDYLDGNVDFPEERSAQKLDLALLLKSESRHKKPEEVESEDIDTEIALKLYDEQPQLVRQVVRAISLHAIGKLNARKLALQSEIENEQLRKRQSVPDPLRRLMSGAADKWRGNKARELHDIESELDELLTQHNLFEQHQRYQLDPDGLIGKALVDWGFFWRKGASEGIFNQMGAAMSQVNQRLNTNWNPLGIGFASIGVDIANADVGDHYVQDALHSASGEVPEIPAAEQAAAITAASTVVGAANNGLMNGPARFGKGTFDRKELGSPPQIGKGEDIVALSRQQKVDEAANKGLLSKRQRKALSWAAAMLDASEGPASSLLSLLPQKEIVRMQERWNRFEELCKFKTNWYFPQNRNDGNPLLGHDGKPIVIDARSTSSAYFRYIPVSRRARLLAADIPKSMWNSMRFWKDTAASGWRGHQWRNLVDGETLVDDDLARLQGRAERLLARLEMRKSDLQIGGLNDEGAIENGISALGVDFAQELRTLVNLPMWGNATQRASDPTALREHLAGQEMRGQIGNLHAWLNWITKDDLAAMAPEKGASVRETLRRLSDQMRELRESISRIDPYEQGAGLTPSALLQFPHLKDFVRTLDDSMLRIEELQDSVRPNNAAL